MKHTFSISHSHRVEISATSLYDGQRNQCFLTHRDVIQHEVLHMENIGVCMHPATFTLPIYTHIYMAYTNCALQLIHNSECELIPALVCITCSVVQWDA